MSVRVPGLGREYLVIKLLGLREVARGVVFPDEGERFGDSGHGSVPIECRGGFVAMADVGRLLESAQRPPGGWEGRQDAPGQSLSVQSHRLTLAIEANEEVNVYAKYCVIRSSKFSQKTWFRPVEAARCQRTHCCAVLQSKAIRTSCGLR